MRLIDQSGDNPALTPSAPRNAERRPLQAFGRRLAEVRRERGLSQKAIALELGVSDDVVSKYERGLHAPKLGTLARLRAVLSVSLDYLLAGAPPSGIKDAQLLRWARAADQLPAEHRGLIALSLESMVQRARQIVGRGAGAGAEK